MIPDLTEQVHALRELHHDDLPRHLKGNPMPRFLRPAKKFNFLVSIDGHVLGAAFAQIHRRKDRPDRITIEMALLLEDPPSDKLAQPRLEPFFDHTTHWVELTQLNDKKQPIGVWRYSDAEPREYFPCEFDAVDDASTPERIIFEGIGGRVP